MIHPLDNPVWSAMTSGNRHLALGDQQAKYFKPTISPFAAVAGNTADCFDALLTIVPDNQPVALFTRETNLIASPWTITNRIDGFQMVFEGVDPNRQPEERNQVTLPESNVVQMLALTQLSPPGPFLPGTIAFGGYEGIYERENLVAMAGRRFDSGTHVEISAVCTHPDHTGKGYARQLIHSQIRQIRAEGKQPYLHVRADNARACRLYERMGFVSRTAMIIYVLRKN